MARTDRSAEGLTSLLVVAISPTLIIFMVGSLVFFLTHMLYDGEFPTRLRFSCGLFVFAAVLIARIAIDEGREYASFFALPLSVVTLFSIMKYTDVGLVFIVPLVAFIWWSTDKLTWDCTVVDDQKDASGQGLLETVGPHAGVPVNLDPEATTQSAASDEQSVWQRWIAHRHRYHTPGVWVIYFGIGAIPVFGLGQALLPEFARGQGFALLCVYVASALALLMTTSFLQLRRYLLQRRLSLPDQTASTWLLTGTMLIAVLMFVCLLLPRPNTGFSLLDSITKATSPEHPRSSRWGFGKEGVSDEEPSGTADAGDAKARSEAAPGGTESEDDQHGGGQDNQQAPADGGESDSQDDGHDSNSNSKTGTAEAKAAKTSGPRKNSDSRDGDQNSGRDDQDSRQRGQKAGQGGQSSDAGAPQGKDPPPPNSQAPANDSQRANTPSSQPARDLKPPSIRAPLNLSLGAAARWIYGGLITLIIGYVIVRYWREIISSLQAFCRDFAEFWRRLFGGKPVAQPVADAPAVQAMPQVRPFVSFEDPFMGGLAAQLSPQQLVTHTFEAMQAWAAERNCARDADQTPLEFAAQLTRSNKQFGALARNLAILYNQAAYAPGSLSGEATEHVRRIWVAMRG